MTKREISHERNNAIWSSEFIATMSHELRSPLSNIHGYTSTLLHHFSHITLEEQQEFLEAILQASNHLILLTDRFLELASLEAGNIIPQVSKIDLPGLITEAVTHLESTTLKKYTHQQASPIQIHTSFLLQEVSLHADRRLLRIVLDNLLENASFFSPSGGRITITTKIFDQHTEAIPFHHPHKSIETQELVHFLSAHNKPIMEIQISDQGMGIPPRHLSMIFERFHRVDTSLTREVNGLGIGLTLCKHILHLHNGMVWATSDMHQGSHFYVWIPLRLQD